MIKKIVYGKTEKNPLQRLWELNEFLAKIKPSSTSLKKDELIREVVGRVSLK